MPASDRIVYGRPFKVTPLWMWIMQRASGVLLGPLVLMHIWSPAMAASPVLNTILLAVILAHGYSGLSRIAVKRGKLGGIQVMTWVWCALVALFGGLVIFASA
jgi:succinate dehydrogenase hydrophobic anchor subunit